MVTHLNRLRLLVSLSLVMSFVPAISGAGISVTAAETKEPAKETATKAPAKENATKAPAKENATKAPANVSATKAPANVSATKAPTNVSATKAPANVSATKAPANVSATKAPANVSATKAPARAAVSGSLQLAKARQEMARRRYSEAVTILSGIVKSNPKDSEAQLLLGQTQIQLRNYPAAKSSLSQALHLSLSAKTASARQIAMEANKALLSLPKKTLDVAIADINATITTREISPSDQAELKPKILDFFAPWCGPCKQFKPVVDRVQKRYAKKIDVVPLDISDPESRAIWRKYGMTAIPALVFLDSNEQMVTYTIGLCDDEAVQWGVKQLLIKPRE